jgi:hypothetical protein
MENPLLEELRQSLPGVTVALPTGGLFYPTGVLAEGADPSHLRIGPFSMWQEIEFRDPYKIASGDAIWRMIGHVAPQVSQPKLLAAVDVDAIMVAARIASYGPKMEMEVTCNNPATKKEGDKEVPACRHQATVPVDMLRLATGYVSIGRPEQYQVTMDNGQVVQIRPVRYESMIEMMKLMLEQRKRASKVKDQDDVPEELVREMFAGAIDFNVRMLRDSVAWVRTKGGVMVREAKAIAAWLDQVPTRYIDLMSEKMDQMTELTKHAGTIKYKCPVCGHAQDSISVTTDFTRFFGQGSRKSGPQRA